MSIIQQIADKRTMEQKANAFDHLQKMKDMEGLASQVAAAKDMQYTNYLSQLGSIKQPTVQFTPDQLAQFRSGLAGSMI